MWKTRHGGSPNFGQFGRVLKPLTAEHSEAEVLKRWQHYLDTQDPQYQSINHFASRFGQWAPPTYRTNGRHMTPAELALWAAEPA